MWSPKTVAERVTERTANVESLESLDGRKLSNNTDCQALKNLVSLI